MFDHQGSTEDRHTELSSRWNGASFDLAGIVARDQMNNTAAQPSQSDRRESGEGKKRSGEEIGSSNQAAELTSRG